MKEHNNYTVFIPTAGIGSRLDNLTKYINKSLVAINNKPTISYIIEKFPEDTEFVIALGYKGSLVKQFIELAYPNKKFKFATVEKYEGEGSGLGLTLLSCEHFLQKPFVFCSCDTLVKEEIAFQDQNTIVFDKRENKSQYRTIEIEEKKAIQLLEKGEDKETSQPYIGLAYIWDWEEFWFLMKEGKEQAIKDGESYVLRDFAKRGKLVAKQHTWFDTGNKEELAKTSDYFKSKNEINILPKENEAIWFIENKVIKFSDDTKFIRDRVERANIIKGFVPEIISNTENMYCYNNVEGTILSKIENITTFEKLLKFSQSFWRTKELTTAENKTFKECCNNFYKNKTLKRINLYYEKFNKKDDKKIINGEKIPNLESILKEVNWSELENGLAGNFHGDFHFENILYNEKYDKFTFLDWRQNFGNSLEIGDIYYDLAKLLHGLIICHELIAKDKYKIDEENNNIIFSFERKPILEECEAFYYKWLKENNYSVKKVKILTALIYLNIAALHHNPYCHLLFNLGKTMLYKNI